MDCINIARQTGLPVTSDSKESEAGSSLCTMWRLKLCDKDVSLVFYSFLGLFLIFCVRFCTQLPKKWDWNCTNIRSRAYNLCFCVIYFTYHFEFALSFRKFSIVMSFRSLLEEKQGNKKIWQSVVHWILRVCGLVSIVCVVFQTRTNTISILN